MKRRPTSVIYLTALYLHHVRGMKTFTARDLYLAGPDAQIWYNDHVPAEILDAVKQLREDYGFTDEMWRDVMRASSTFYFSPSYQITDCNNAIRRMMKNVVLINRYWEQSHACAAAVSRAYKWGQFVLIHEKPRTYRLADSIVDHPSFK